MTTLNDVIHLHNQTWWVSQECKQSNIIENKQLITRNQQTINCHHRHSTRKLWNHYFTFFLTELFQLCIHFYSDIWIGKKYEHLKKEGILTWSQKQTTKKNWCFFLWIINISVADVVKLSHHFLSKYLRNKKIVKKGSHIQFYQNIWINE